jgi:hypothetical protein
MPRPLRKPKKFASATSQNETAAAPIVSTPVRHAHSNTSRLLSPNLSPIPDTANFPIFQDESVPLHDEFGFSRVRGIKKTVIAMPTEFDSDADIDDNQPSKEDDVDEDLYGVPPDPAAREDRPSPPSMPQSPKPRPKKAIRHPRTSELLCLLPTRKKRRPTQPQRKQRKQLRTLATSDVNSDDDTTRKRYGKTDAVDKENDAPEESSETEPEIVERRTIVKQKFAEIDRWEMAFESVDLSFSSQNS